MGEATPHICCDCTVALKKRIAELLAAGESVPHMLRVEAEKYHRADGEPGVLACCWGWRDIASTLRGEAARFETLWRKAAG